MSKYIVAFFLIAVLYPACRARSADLAADAVVADRVEARLLGPGGAAQADALEAGGLAVAGDLAADAACLEGGAGLPRAAGRRADGRVHERRGRRRVRAGPVLVGGAWLAPAGGAGPAVSDLLASFSLTNNFRAVTLGQLKNAAAPFHDRLTEVGLATGYPWAGQPADSALANVGQVKALFAFDLSRDTDGDGMPDGWEAAHGFNPLVCQTGGVHGPADDPDGDDMPNAEEGAWGTDPWFPDTDGDLLSDAREVLVHMTDPLLPDTDDNGLEDGYQASVALGSSANLTPISVAVFLDAEKGLDVAASIFYI